MPTLFRILALTTLLFAMGYGALWALANLVEPTQREITITLPPERLDR